MLGFAIALLCGASVAACGGDANSAQRRSVESGGATIRFEFDDGVTAADRTLVQETVAASRKFYKAALGRDLKLEITVKVTTKDGGNLLGYSFGRTAWIFTGSENWPEGSSFADVAEKQRIVAHELFHNFQWDRMYTDDALPGRSPWWILEGSAEYASARFLVAEYGGEWPDFVERYRLYVASAGPVPSLDSDALKTADLYAKSMLAFEELMGRESMKVLGSYFEATGRMDWDDAFYETFDEDPSAFLERFESNGP
jgi:hypothetical protein